jgi:hypothetical protein
MLRSVGNKPTGLGHCLSHLWIDGSIAASVFVPGLAVTAEHSKFGCAYFATLDFINIGHPQAAMSRLIHIIDGQAVASRFALLLWLLMTINMVNGQYPIVSFVTPRTKQTAKHFHDSYPSTMTRYFCSVAASLFMFPLIFLRVPIGSDSMSLTKASALLADRFITFRADPFSFALGFPLRMSFGFSHLVGLRNQIIYQ